jgi:S1-C subfamily serine protease
VGVAGCIGYTMTLTASSVHGGDAPAATSAVVSDIGDLAAIEQQFEQLSTRLAPSVVAISATAKAVESNALVRADDLNADQLASAVFDKSARLVGTGFVIDSDGYLLTNDHVVAEAQQLWVTTDDRKVYPAIVVGTDPRTDLAVLKIPARGLPPVRFATGEARRGQWSIALGNPYGLSSDGEICMSVGIVSGVNRSLPKLASNENRLYSNLIQTTAQINPGNSGGPLFNLAGEVIGINTAVVLPHRQANGIGFAIPADRDILELVRDLKDGREIVHGFLGIAVSRPTLSDRAAVGMTSDAGARVDTVEAGSPAALAGLMRGDVIESIDGQTLRDGDHLIRSVALADIAKPLSMKVHRGRTTMSIFVQLRPRTQTQVAVNRTNQRLRWGGMVLGPVPGHWQSAGVMVLAVNKAAGSIPEGVATGAIITSIAGKPIGSIADLQAVLNDTPAEHCKVELMEPKDAVVSVGRE